MDYPIRVLEQYDLGSVASYRRIERGYVSRIWDVTTSAGRYVLRRRHPHLCDPALVAAQHALIRHLRLSNFPAPVLLHTPSGASFVSLGDLCYEVQIYIPGSPCDDRRPAHLAEAARVLARYHRLVLGLDDPWLHLSHVRYHPNSLEAIVARLIGDRDRLSRRQRGIAERLRRHAAEIQARLAGFDLLPSLVIHGDYYSGNLIFRDNKIVGVLDYDLAHWAPRVVEVAEALIYFAREDLRRTRGAPRFRHIVYAGWVDLDLVSRFIAAYRQKGELTPAEIRALPDVMRLIWLSASLSPPLRPRLRMDRDAEALTEVLTLADWARENSQALSSALRARSYG